MYTGEVDADPKTFFKAKCWLCSLSSESLHDLRVSGCECAVVA